MARIKAHGEIVGTVEFTTHAKRYMSDGKILVNRGFGWKLGGKIKPELAHLSPAELYQRSADHKAAWNERNPVAAGYQKALHDICGLSKRWKLHGAVTMMPDDPDGVWSMCCDDYGGGVSADLDDIVRLCRLYKAAITDAKMVRELA